MYEGLENGEEMREGEFVLVVKGFPRVVFVELGCQLRVHVRVMVGEGGGGGRGGGVGGMSGDAAHVVILLLWVRTNSLIPPKKP